MKLSQTQFQVLLELSTSVPAVFAGDTDDNVEELSKDIPTEGETKAILPKEKGASNNEEAQVHLHPELGTHTGTWTKLDLVFKMGNIGMELLVCDPNEPIEDVVNASLSKFSLNKTHVKLRMISDGSIESEILIQSFTINDSRHQETNKFRKVMSSTNTEGSQFMASVTISSGSQRNLIAMLTIDSPRIIFALDYIFAVKDFVMTGLAIEEEAAPFDPDMTTSAEDSGADDTSQDTFDGDDLVGSRIPTSKSRKSIENESKQEGMNISFRVNIVDAQVILIANPGSTSSEAIVLGTKQVLVAQQHALTVEITKVGMFLCRMDKFDTTRLRILDDFGLKVSMESKSVGTSQSITNISMDIEPLILRVSLRDIMLAMQIINKASELSGSTEPPEENTAPKRIQAPRASSSTSLKKRTASGKAISTIKKQTKPAPTSNVSSGYDPPEHSTILSKEELKANIEGLRLILIGDAHELPLLDISIKHFTTRLGDWSTEVH